MKIVSRMIKNAIFLALADMIAKGFYFVLILALVRIYSPEVFGEYITFVTVVYVTLALTDMGVQHVLVRELASEQVAPVSLVSNALLVSIGMALMGWMLLLFYAGLGGYSPELRNLLMVAGSAVIGNAVMQTAFAVFRGRQRMEVQGALSVLHQLMVSAIGISLAMVGLGIRAQAMSIIFCSLVGALFSISIVHIRFVRIQIKFDRRVCMNLVIQSVPIGVLLLFTILLRWADVLILGQMQSMDAVAMYAAPSKIFDGVVLLIACGIMSAIPVFSKYWVEDPLKARHMYIHLRRVSAVFGCGAAGGLVVLADSICLTMFGDAYLYAAVPLRILGLSMLFIALCGPMFLILVVSGDILKRFLPIIGGLSIINIILNFLLVPSLSYVAAAIAFFLTASGLFAVSHVVGKVAFGELPSLWRILLRPGLAAIGMVSVLWFVRWMHLAIAVPLGTAIFIALLGCFGEFRQESFYRELFGKTGTWILQFFQRPNSQVPVKPDREQE
jgi:O-antigen/teichoic acid export membrane protein